MGQWLVRNINTKEAYLLPSIGSIQTSSMMLLRKSGNGVNYSKKKVRVLFGCPHLLASRGIVKIDRKYYVGKYGKGRFMEEYPWEIGRA